MNLISVESLSMSYADKTLFESLNFGLAQSQKVAIVGQNGSGKSTLLKIISGEIQPDEGQVTFRKGTTVGYLPQVPKLDEDASILDNLFAQNNEVAQTVLAYEEAVMAGEGDLQHLLDKMDRLNAWDFESKAKMVMSKLGIHNTERIVSNLSGGQKKRVALSKLLLEEPDVILLDEPTNHLDIEAIEWLEKFLLDNFANIILITHDRYFLEAITDEILELNDQKLYKHKGKYSQFLENRIERQKIAKTEKDKAQNLMKKELDWLRKQPKARGTKAKYRIDAFDDVKTKAKKNIDTQEAQLNIKSTRQGKKIAELHDISQEFNGETIFSNFTHKFAKGERVGVVGKNGAGKSTFLNILTGKLKPTSGKVVIGEITKFGYYTQEAVNLNPANRVIEEVRDIADYIKLSDGSKISVPKFLEQFLFDSKKQYDFVEKLSGGEKKRLQLLKVLLSEPNFLILDEPTNDFDIDTLNVLEEYLAHFDGGLLVVTHDRYFLDRLCDHLFVFDETEKIQDFPGNYTDYRAQKEALLREDKKQSKNQDKTKTSVSKPKGNSGKASYKEKREYESLSTEIDQLEREKNSLTQSLSETTEHEKLQEISEKIESLNAEIEKKSDRWLELSEIVEG